MGEALTKSDKKDLISGLGQLITTTVTGTLGAMEKKQAAEESIELAKIQAMDEAEKKQYLLYLEKKNLELEKKKSALKKLGDITEDKINNFVYSTKKRIAAKNRLVNVWKTIKKEVENNNDVKETLLKLFGG